MKQLQTIDVVYIITKLELGGAQKVCLSLLQGVDSSGLRTALISGNQGALVEQAQEAGRTILLSSLRREVGLKSIWLELKTFFSLISTLRKLRKKNRNLIVHTHSTKAGLLGRWAAFFAGVKKRVHTVHGFGFHEFQSWPVWLIHVALEWLTCFITTTYVCVSNKDIKTGSALFFQFERKAELIRAAVDWDTFFVPAPTWKLKQEFRLGLIGCFKPQKNIFDALTAFHLFYTSLPCKDKNNVSLEIIGDGVLRSKIEEWIAQRGLQKVVHLLGWQFDISGFVKKWDVMLSSSLWEGLPCAIVEARLSKVPVIAYNVGGISEVIHDGINGFLIEPGNYRQLQEKLSMVYLQPELRKKLTMYADKLAPFSTPSMIQHHTSLYLKLCQKKHNMF